MKRGGRSFLNQKVATATGGELSKRPKRFRPAFKLYPNSINLPCVVVIQKP